MCKAIEKNREAAERRSAKSVNRLAMIADHDQIGTLAAELPEQFELRDIGVLEFIDQDVAVTCAQRFPQCGVFAQAHDGVHNLRSEREQFAVAKQQVAGAIC